MGKALIIAPLIIAIDGPSAAGKSTLGRLLAQRYNYLYIDTGAMYRALAWKALQLGILPNDEPSLTALLKRSSISLKNIAERDDLMLQILWDGDDVTPLIRTPEVGMTASKVSALPGVRLAMVEMQRKIGQHGGVVMDGRDIGSFVFPKADKKFFLIASMEERTRRRFEELRQKGIEVSYQEVMADLQTRDQNDQTRALAPLIKAEGAIVIDSTDRNIQEVFEIMVREIDT